MSASTAGITATPPMVFQSMNETNGEERPMCSELSAGAWTAADLPWLKMALALTGFPCALQAIRALEGQAADEPGAAAA
jgi:hypothetical protein